MLKIGKKNKILIIFGGRTKGNKVLNDLWFLSRDKNNSYCWNRVNLENSNKKDKIGIFILYLIKSITNSSFST